MITIITWNTGKKKTTFLQNSLAEIVTEHQPDILVFQECLGQYVNTILNPTHDEIPYPGKGLDRRVRIFLRKNTFHRYATNTAFNNKLVFVHLKKIGGIEDFNIAGCHLYSKLNTEMQQMWKNKPFSDTLIALEKTQSNNENTILIGDFNYNPYDRAMLDPNVFNAIDNKFLISNFGLNPVGKRNHNYWYNPMWNLLGDYDLRTNTNKQATGTYFFYNEAEIPYWSLLDGTLLRPTIMDRIDYDSSEILVKTNNRNFIKPLIIGDDESDLPPKKWTLVN